MKSSRSLEQHIKAWIDKNLDKVSARRIVINSVEICGTRTDHLDHILGRDWNDPDAINLSLLAFSVLARQIQDRGTPAKPMLSIPLHADSNKLSLDIPRSLKTLKKQWRSIEPPSLYLVDWELSKYMNSYEGYRCPLPFTLLEPDIAGVNAFYSEGRTLDDMKHDWEYGRFVIVEYYPEQYRL